MASFRAGLVNDEDKWFLETTKTATDSPLIMQRRRCTSTFIAWLLHLLEKEIAGTLLYCDTTSEQVRSSSEAECHAKSRPNAEITRLVNLLHEVGHSDLKPVTLHYDNKSAIQTACNPGFHERTKHLKIDCHFTREEVMNVASIVMPPTYSNKIVLLEHHHELLFKLGMLTNCSPSPV